jgi:ferredoxin
MECIGNGKCLEIANEAFSVLDPRQCGSIYLDPQGC